MAEGSAPTTTPALVATDVPTVGTTFRLQFEQAQNSWVLLYPEGMVKLSQSAGEILNRCDGQRDIATIVGLLEEAFGEQDLGKDVMSFLEIALEQKWISRAAAS